MFDSQRTYVVYDGECPFCSRYVKLIRLREALGPVVLVDARTHHPAVDYVRDRGVDLNNEMALILRGEIHSGADCINRLALMSTGVGMFNQINAVAFSTPGVAAVAYPVMRSIRNLTLRVLGRQPISSRAPSPADKSS